jgi:CRISPR/Cas system-associated endoribonuclease Cas2
METKRTMQRTIQTRSWFFEKINIITRVTRVTRGHKDSILLNKITNEKGNKKTEIGNPKNQQIPL